MRPSGTTFETPKRMDLRVTFQWFRSILENQLPKSQSFLRRPHTRMSSKWISFLPSTTSSNVWFAKRMFDATPMTDMFTVCFMLSIYQMSRAKSFWAVSDGLFSLGHTIAHSILIRSQRLGWWRRQGKDLLGRFLVIVFNDMLDMEYRRLHFETAQYIARWHR